MSDESDDEDVPLSQVFGTGTGGQKTASTTQPEPERKSKDKEADDDEDESEGEGSSDEDGEENYMWDELIKVPRPDPPTVPCRDSRPPQYGPATAVWPSCVRQLTPPPHTRSPER